MRLTSVLLGPDHLGSEAIVGEGLPNINVSRVRRLQLNDRIRRRELW